MKVFLALSFMLISLLAPAVIAGTSDNELKRSPVVALSSGAATIDLPVTHLYSHNFAGVIYFSDANGEIQVAPTAGSETFTIETIVQPGIFQSFTDNTLNSATPSQVDWSANTIQVRVVLAGVSGGGATHCQLIFYGNES